MNIFGIDLILLLYSVAAFVLIGVWLTGMILFVKNKFIRAEKCKLYINENPDLTKNVIGGGTLLSTLSKLGIAVPSPCGGKATCLQCRVQVTEGEDPPL